MSYSRQQAMQGEGEGEGEGEREQREWNTSRESKNPIIPMNSPYNPKMNQRNEVNSSYNPQMNQRNAVNNSSNPQMNQRNAVNSPYNPPNQPRAPRNPINNTFYPQNQPLNHKNLLNNHFSAHREPRPQLTPLNSLGQTPLSTQQCSLPVLKPVSSSGSYTPQNSVLLANPRSKPETNTAQHTKPTPVMQNPLRNTEHTRHNPSISFQTSPTPNNPISLFTTSSSQRTSKGNSLLGLAASLQQQYFDHLKFIVCLKNRFFM